MITNLELEPYILKADGDIDMDNMHNLVPGWHDWGIKVSEWINHDSNEL